MDSSLLAARAAGGDLEAFGQLYDAYFARVYDFAWRVLRDADAAGEVTRRTFETVAPALGRAAGADVRSWLLLTAAQQALAHPRAANAGLHPLHEEAFGAFDVPDPCRLTDPSLTRGDHELACLAWEAATRLGPRDFAALDLWLRQGLAPAALAPVLQVSKGSAATLLARLQREADEAMRTFILARRGGKDCEPLRGMLAEAGFPPYTDDARAAVDAHVAGCRTCASNRALPAAPTAILAALAIIDPPLVLKGDVWRAVVTAWPARGEDAIAAVTTGLMARSLEAAAAGGAGAGALPLEELGAAGGGGSDGGDGFGWYGEGDEGRRNVIWFAAAAAGMLAVAFIVGGIAVGAFGFGGGGGGGGLASRTSTPAGVETPGVTTSPGVSVDTPTPAPSPTETETPTETPPPADTPTRVPPTAPPSPTRPANTPTRPAGTPTVPPKPTPGGPPTPTHTPSLAPPPAP